MDPLKLLPLPPEYALDTGTAALSRRRDTVEVPVFWIVLVLSVLVHLAILFFVPPWRLTLRPGGDPDMPLAVALQPRLPPAKVPESAAPAPKPEPAPPPVAVAPRPKPPRPVPPAPRVAPPSPPPAARAPSTPPAPPRPSAPPVITQPAPEPQSPIARAEPTAPERVETPPAGDLSSYIEARRRARGESSAPAATPSSEEPAPLEEEARRNRIVARNLGLDRAPSFGGPPKTGGGMFQLTNLHYGYAEFIFYGWNREIRRNTSQLIEVRRGEHPSIELAVIRRMIAIIREHESGDFLWESTRLGRDVMLSARPADNAGLEDFLMREFFGDSRRSVGAASGFPR